MESMPSCGPSSRVESTPSHTDPVVVMESLPSHVDPAAAVGSMPTLIDPVVAVESTPYHVDPATAWICDVPPSPCPDCARAPSRAYARNSEREGRAPAGVLPLSRLLTPSFQSFSRPLSSLFPFSGLGAPGSAVDRVRGRRPVLRLRPHVSASAGPMASLVELGFAEEAPAWRLRNAFFPSKLYAPLPGRPDAFHRGLFLFCCRDASCCAGLRATGCNARPFKRSVDGGQPLFLDGVVTCQVPFGRQPLFTLCALPEPSCELGDKIPDHGFLFPEYEIVRETEDEVPPDVLDEDDDVEPAGSVGDVLAEELESMAKHESREDKIFQKFKRQIALEPEQILRYGRGAAPVWISADNVPQEEDIPNCPCGAKRVFEFQVMPQLLNLLKADSLGRSIDWGVLAVFTCADSCTLGAGYAEEFVWKQDVSATA
ncbi:programmed cell death protein 2 [Orycteropus afer afer]|uniref:Programmed cell death protein 2 n=1 Tax=Orycteropus afer afer TaxID=1230840 RepID=A0AC54Z9F1_ORYAF|nr:programmed cell death protein 2 [Orycteropus afer afer]